MFWFILCVAVLNMAAGVGLAVYLADNSTGDQSPEYEDSASDSTAEDFNLMLSAGPDALETPPPAVSPEEAAADRENEQDFPQDLEDSADSSGTSMPADPDAAVSAADRKDGQDFPQDLEDSVDSSGNSLMADLDAAVSAALDDATLPEDESEMASPHEEERLESPENEPLQAFRSQLANFCEELVALDNQLRTKAPEDAGELKSQLDTMVASTQKQDEACQEAEQSLREMISAEAIDEKQGEAILAVIQKERQESAETAEAIEKIDLDAELTILCDELLDRTANMLEGNYSLRDGLSDMIAATLPSDRQDVAAEVDPPTGIMSRAALDATLAEHWEEDPQRARVVTVSVIDVDHFAKLNREHGPAIGDRVLRAVAQLLANESPAGCQVARFAGQQFALLAIDGDLKQASNDTERMRQTIETVRLEHKELDLKITVSCGVVAATSDDTQETLYARAIGSIQEAKRYGRNRSCIHEGERPIPVVPPNFDLIESHAPGRRTLDWRTRDLRHCFVERARTLRTPRHGSGGRCLRREDTR